MTERPRCDHIPQWGSSEHRCRRDAQVRVLGRHDAGITPEYRDRCLQHAVWALGPDVAGIWDEEAGMWRSTD